MASLVLASPRWLDDLIWQINYGTGGENGPPLRRDTEFYPRAGEWCPGHRTLSSSEATARGTLVDLAGKGEVCWAKKNRDVSGD